jgi:CubicO group peptidase (beta-lactamase class C family)
LNPSADKSLIKLEDLLTMRSGLKWMEGDQTTFSAPDPARAMLARDVVDLPVGQVWNYSSGATDIASEVLRLTTGMTPLEYGKAKLFGPLGIVNPTWEAGLTGTNHGGWGLSLTAREMARFGELFRNSGVWAGKQVVPSAWTDTSTTPHCSTSWGMQYGYLWWVPNLPGFFATIGAFGQQIFVNREKGIVVVFTANLPSDKANTIFEGLIKKYVLPAIK